MRAKVIAWISVISAVLFAVASLSSCGGDNVKPDDEEDILPVGKVEHIGTVPDEFKSIVENNLFYYACSSYGKILTSFYDNIDHDAHIAEPHVQMMDIYGNLLSECILSTDDAYRVTTLTATADGGFLFVLGFNDYSYGDGNGTWASDKGYASRVIKCDKSGSVQFDTPFENADGNALEFCYEINGCYYLFESIHTPEKRKPGVYTYTDVYAAVLDKDGVLINSRSIGGSDFDSLYFAEPVENGFLLTVSSQSDDGDFAFSDSGGYPVYWTVGIGNDLEITDKKKEEGRDLSDGVVGHKIVNNEFEPVYKSDDIFDGFDAGDPTAYIDYGDFYMIVSENVTGTVENPPPEISRVLYYTETVYSAYGADGELIFRTSVDSSPDFDGMAE